ncbi:dipeptide ABC transporter ATP-binding protein [Lacibacterium aquatile]|uniref:Dipeptide ABC transporter ATP-binding protein n=1 Tax=Lacibacterium aquatile TaxID=1168082 RepID=A0ABW5DQF2_9PROT
MGQADDQASGSAPLLSLRSLSIEFQTESGPLRAVQDLSLEVSPGKTLAIVGESGSGKSVTSLAILRLTDHTGGKIAGGRMLFRRENGSTVDLSTLDEASIQQIRGNEIAMIFQEPMTSLNPVFTIGDQIAEAIILHRGISRKEARAEALALLEKVRLPDADQMLDRYPHQLSGGMRQRAMIAMALSCRPKLLIADEPTTALDVTIQAQILNTIRELQAEFGTAVIFITHDMGVVAEMADDVVVMWRGRKVEQGPVSEIFATPKHPYTKALLSAVPRLGSLTGQPLPKRTPLIVMDGEAQRTIGSEQILDTADYKAPILSVRDLTTRFTIKKNLLGQATHNVHAVEKVSFDLYPGETLALVGESGSGKSTIGRTIQQLVQSTSGSISFEGRDLASMSKGELRSLRQQIQYIFQDPFASLDPRRTVGFSIAEPIHTHKLLEGKAVEKRVHELLEQVGLKPEHARRYPHEFSGGQRQRICIARALSCDPKLIIADESVSALDVSIQAQIIDLLMELQQRRKLAYLFITHDMAVVEKISHRVAVLYMGQIVEIGPRPAVLETPRHSYTQKLLSAVPVPEPGRHVDRRLITGEIPSPVRKAGDEPTLNQMIEIAGGHWVAAESRTP